MDESQATDPPEIRSTLCLWGFMGTGKSTVGALVARQMSAVVIDLDAMIEADARMSISELFASQGEEAFRRLERQALQAVCQPAKTARVIALGGGTLVDDASRKLALAQTFVVTLTATVTDILERTANTDNRPLLRGRQAEQDVRRLLDARSAAYGAAHWMVDTSSLTPDAVAKHLTKRWRPALHDG